MVTIIPWVSLLANLMTAGYNGLSARGESMRPVRRADRRDSKGLHCIQPLNLCATATYMPMEIFPSIFLHILLFPLLSKFCSASDTLSSNETITYGKTLVSSGQSFELGFIVWSSNSSKSEPGTVAQLLESGNLVLRRKYDNTQNYVWQNFVFPSDTLLPGMKQGWNLSTGVNRYLTSWKDDDDPSLEDITFRLDNIGMPQSVVWKGSEKIFWKGPWNGIQGSGAAGWSNPVYKSILVYNNEELYNMNELVDNSTNIRITANRSGLVQRYLLKKGEASGKLWIHHRSQWDVLDWSSGCVRRIPLRCQQDPIKFLKLGGVQLPDLIQFSLNTSMSLKECRAECLKRALVQLMQIQIFVKVVVVFSCGSGI
ncbi:G-type lectin S-receptor-like serine/threonine-protein kinase [Abeliophyllum distichum]|uniref:G-type lectin S-receptor-like serine/threonine-protein kinase n=1 Tax=Abeliophyllum distichum TaxID=126358 RepID=A0ABD1UF16_9LAMI